jgi:hypothetical protein
MFGLFRKSSRDTTADPEFAPAVGVPVRDVTAALAVVDALAIDRRILRVEVLTEGRLKVVTGHVAGPLTADVHHLTLERQSSGWQVVEHHHLVS